MEKALIDKICLVLNKKTHLPFIRLTDLSGEVLFESIQPHMKKLTHLDKWNLALTSYHKKATLLIKKTQDYFRFIGPMGLIYCLKPIYINNQKVAEVILGGFRVDNLDEKGAF
ncbi:MAG: hypothetical protein LBV67_06900, partial [Streptococcaceae bacterium]|nr:hypothetical protein [Streptococcaceae bacterium]